MTETEIELLREFARAAEKDAQAWQARATAADALLIDYRERLAAAEGERDALDRERADYRNKFLLEKHAREEALEERNRMAEVVADAGERAAAAESALAEARGREKALREALEALTNAVTADDWLSIPDALDKSDAALALPYSTQGRPEKDLKAVAPGLKSEEGE